MQAAEFDKFAEEYLASHRDNIRLTGEDPDYFSRYKLVEVRRRWEGLQLAEPREILDFGTGIGSSLPHIASSFPQAKLVGVDVSQASLAVARNRFPGVADLVSYGGERLPFEDGRFDLVFTACVFHHIPAEEHVRLLREVRRVLKPGGVLVVWEHNPVNPVTRYIVATCPFDENAVLIPAGTLLRREREAGFRNVHARFAGFFPRSLAALRVLEPMLAPLPLGAQYYTWAVA